MIKLHSAMARGECVGLYERWCDATKEKDKRRHYWTYVEKDGQLYARLFSLVHQWEKEVETPCFQYIVTTTTAPPPELQGDNHIRLRMSSTPAEMRLFGMDI